MTYILIGLAIVTVLHIYYRIGCVHQTASHPHTSALVGEHRDAIQWQSNPLASLEKSLVAIADVAYDAQNKIADLHEAIDTSTTRLNIMERQAAILSRMSLGKDGGQTKTIGKYVDKWHTTYDVVRARVLRESDKRLAKPNKADTNDNGGDE